MVAAFVQLDHGRTVVAALPAIFLGCIDEASHIVVLWALAARVPFAVAEAANFGIAAPADAIPAAACGAAAGVDMDIAGLDPLPAVLGRTVYPVLCGVFLVFLVPFDFEFHVEKSIDVLKGDVV